MTIAQLERRVRRGASALEVMRLCREHGVPWSIIAEQLTAWGYSTSTGRKWAAENARLVGTKAGIR